MWSEFLGVFLIDSTLLVTNPVVIRGDDRAHTEITPSEFKSTLKAADGLNAPIISATSQLKIEGIGFDGNRDNQTSFTGNGLVELIGGNVFLECHLSDVIVSESVTNAIYVYRHEVQTENVKTMYNDGDGWRFGAGIADGDIAFGDMSLRSIQSGFNKGWGINFQKISSIRGYNVDSYQNNAGGVRLARSSESRFYGLQCDLNGGHGLKFEHNIRNIQVFGGLIYDSNNNQLENYRDSGVSEETNPSPSGTYANVYIDNTGNLS